MFPLLIFVFTVSSLTHGENIASSSLYQKDNNCVLPSYPEHGRYTVSNHPSATPGERYPCAKLDIYCDTGYLNNSTMKSIFCVNGEWSAAIHTCVRDLLGFCTLPSDELSVMYQCLSSQRTHERSRGCENFIPTGTLVIPVCRPGYFSAAELPEMHCRNGKWDYNPICKPACGLTTQHLQLEGTSTNHLELPWNAVIYYKEPNYEFYVKCTGSLITDTKIISTALCFYDSETKLIPASNFKVAVNKMYILYNDSRETNSQYSDVDKFLIPSSYKGPATYYENNIAIVVVKRAFFFHLHIRPVCLDFDSELDSTQLAEGNSGKTVHVLDVLDLSYLKNQDCNTLVKADNRHFLTKDKFCARRSNATWSNLMFRGGGLVFLESTTQRYYLRGVHDGAVNATDDGVIYLYTSKMKHERFIKEHL